MEFAKIKEKILSSLIDKYETSKSFTGDNKVEQSFSMQISKLFPKYEDDSEYELFCEINETIQKLEEQNLIVSKTKRNGVVEKIALNLDKLELSYETLGRRARRDIFNEVESLLNHYAISVNNVLVAYSSLQLERIKVNKNIEFFTGNIQELSDILIAVESLYQNQTEIFVRDFSIKLYGDSKRFEQIGEKVKSLLFEYGDFPEKETLLEELNIVKTPTYVAMKGSGKLHFGQQMLDISKLRGDISLSSISLGDITDVEVTGNKVITVENLTSFHTLKEKDAFVIYLGGFHNTVRRSFIKKMYATNPSCRYYHFGDIDAGGFYIYEHLKTKTGVPFLTYKMDVETLKQYQELWKPLTANDRKRLERLLEMGGTNPMEAMSEVESIAEVKSLSKVGRIAEEESLSEVGRIAEEESLSKMGKVNIINVKKNGYMATLQFMLANGCKLEQEGVDA